MIFLGYFFNLDFIKIKPDFLFHLKYAIHFMIFTRILLQWKKERKKSLKTISKLAFINIYRRRMCLRWAWPRSIWKWEQAYLPKENWWSNGSWAQSKRVGLCSSSFQLSDACLCLEKVRNLLFIFYFSKCYIVLMIN